MEESGGGQSLSTNVSASDVLNSMNNSEATTNVTTGAEAEQAPVEGIKAEEVLSQEQELKGEEKGEESTEDAKNDELFSSKFAALSRKEKALRQRERELDERMSELESKLEATREPEEVKIPLETRLRKDPLGTLEEMGVGYDVLTDIMLNEGKLPLEMQTKLMLEERDRSLRSELEELKAQLAEKETREVESRHEQTINNFKGEIEQHVSSMEDKYEMLSVEGDDAVDLVYNVISQHFEQSGDVLDVQTATELTEEYLYDEAKKRSKLKKVRKLLEAQENKATESKPLEKQESVTLSNDQSQTSTTGSRHLSDDEAKLEAAKLIRWIED